MRARMCVLRARVRQGAHRARGLCAVYGHLLRHRALTKAWSVLQSVTAAPPHLTAPATRSRCPPSPCAPRVMAAGAGSGGAPHVSSLAAVHAHHTCHPRVAPLRGALRGEQALRHCGRRGHAPEEVEHPVAVPVLRVRALHHLRVVAAVAVNWAPGRGSCGPGWGMAACETGRWIGRGAIGELGGIHLTHGSLIITGSVGAPPQAQCRVRALFQSAAAVRAHASSVRSRCVTVAAPQTQVAEPKTARCSID